MLVITDKNLIGRKEKVDFPDLDLYEIDAKIDTGAHTSAIHCHNVKLSKKDKQKLVTFNLLDPSHPAYNEKEFTLPVYSDKYIKNSFGQTEHRYVIKTSILIFDQTYPIELSLADRSKMEVPVLIGRKLLRKNFIVDVEKVNVSFKARRKKVKQKKTK